MPSGVVPSDGGHNDAYVPDAELRRLSAKARFRPVPRVCWTAPCCPCPLARSRSSPEASPQGRHLEVRNRRQRGDDNEKRGSGYKERMPETERSGQWRRRLRADDDPVGLDGGGNNERCRGNQQCAPRSQHSPLVMNRTTKAAIAAPFNRCCRSATTTTFQRRARTTSWRVVARKAIIQRRGTNREHTRVHREKPTGDRQRLQIDGIDHRGNRNTASRHSGFRTSDAIQLQGRDVEPVGASQIAGAYEVGLAILDERAKPGVVLNFHQQVSCRSPAANRAQKST